MAVTALTIVVVIVMVGATLKSSTRNMLWLSSIHRGIIDMPKETFTEVWAVIWQGDVIALLKDEIVAEWLAAPRSGAYVVPWTVNSRVFNP